MRVVFKQAAWRCMAAKRYLAAARTAACVLQATWRQRCARQQLAVAKRDCAAAKIQAAWRSRAVRVEFEHLMRQSRAAILIQRAFRSCRRGEQLRQVLREVVEQAVAFEGASRVIQCIWRAKVCQSRDCLGRFSRCLRMTKYDRSCHWAGPNS
jgi:hypothetical protein